MDAVEKLRKVVSAYPPSPYDGVDWIGERATIADARAILAEIEKWKARATKREKCRCGGDVTDPPGMVLCASCWQHWVKELRRQGVEEAKARAEAAEGRWEELKDMLSKHEKGFPAVAWVLKKMRQLEEGET